LNFSLIGTVSAETIIFKSGKKMEEKILERTSEYIKVDIYGVPVAYFMDEIASIDGQEMQGGASSIPKEIILSVSDNARSSLISLKAQVPFGISLGTGFIIDKKGIILTALHVVAGAKNIEAKLPDGSVYFVKKIVGYDTRRDVCILKIDDNNFPCLPLGDSDELKERQSVLAIEASSEYSEGLFNGYREFQDEQCISFTAPVKTGYSGGPLLDIKGRVVGIIITGQLGKKFSYATPINLVKPLLLNSANIIDIERFTKAISESYLYCFAGEAAFNSDKLDLALEFLEKAISIDSNLTEAHLYLGMVYAQKNLIDRAFREFDAVCSMAPRNYLGYYNRGIINNEKGNFNQAILDYNKAIEIEPSDPEVYHNRAYTYFLKKEYDKAWEDVHKTEQLGAKVNSKFLTNLKEESRREK